MKWMIREKEMTTKNLMEEMNYICNDLARNETHFIMFALSFSFHNNTRQCPKSCAGTCLYFIIKVVDTSASTCPLTYHSSSPRLIWWTTIYLPLCFLLLFSFLSPPNPLLTTFGIDSEIRPDIYHHGMLVHGWGRQSTDIRSWFMKWW